MSTTPNLGLPYIDAGQAQKHVTHNEAIRALDTLVQLAVLDRDLAAPPASPAEGRRWIVKTGATGAWSGHDNRIAAWQDGAWQFSAPATGWIAYVADEEILVAWDGTAWHEIGAPAGGPREALTANRTYYVRTDGSDSNDGLANSAGGAFATIQKAIDVVFGTLDLSGFDVTIQVGGGTYGAGAVADAPQVGKGNVTVLGDSATPSNVLVSTTNANGFNAKNGAKLNVNGFKIATAAFGYALRAEINSVINFSNLEFGACASFHILASQFSTVNALTAYAISGGANGHFLSDGGWIEVPNRAVTLSGSLAFALSFAQAQDGGVIRSFNGTTYSGGTITGKRYSSATNSVVQTFGGGINHFPGNVAGTTDTGGQYA